MWWLLGSIIFLIFVIVLYIRDYIEIKRQHTDFGKAVADYMYNRKRGEMMIKGERMIRGLFKCEDCGKISEDVEETICPFEWEIHDIEEKIIVCEDCYHERSQDI